MASGDRLLGVTVLPEWAQAEGVEAVLDRLEAAGVNAVATSPYVMEPVADGDGSREPPADGGAGGVRLLDRELWGRRALHVRTAPSFVPDTGLYDGLSYRPPEPDGLTDRDGAVVARFIAAAKARGMTVHLQVQAAIPPGYRVQFGGPHPEDQPLGPDDAPVPGRVDANASLASPTILAYGQALIADVAAAYPEVDAIRVDWPEYPPYHFDALFFDFSPHALAAAGATGLDTDRMRRDMLALKSFLLGGLSDAAVSTEGAAILLDRASERFPGVKDMLALKTHLILAMLRAYRDALPDGMGLVPQAFPPPFHLVSGFDFGQVAGIADAIGVKLYTMHWPMILRHWGDRLAASNPSLSEANLASALVRTAQTGGPEPAGLDDLRYPEPDEPHPAGDQAMASKIAAAREATGGRCPVDAFAHAYGPADDVERRARVAWQASGGRMWINRYGYLSDEKIARLRRLAMSA